jgi:putative tryptophan/tyrosine transport system substrate-binding protein
MTQSGHSGLRIAAAQNDHWPHFADPSAESIYQSGGGFISYGVDLPDEYRQAATYVDLILKGAKPGDLPVQLPTKYGLIVNLKTAKALGLIIPEAFLQTADEVIE